MKKQISRLFCAAMVFTVAMGSLVACGGKDKSDNEAKYNDACALIESGDYASAYEAFKDLGDYKDSEKYLSRFTYFPTTVDYVLSDRSGTMTVELGIYNMPTRMISIGTIGTKDGTYTYDDEGNLMQQAILYNGVPLRFDYTYDADNNLIKAEYFEEDVLMMVNEYFYEDGIKVRESSIVEGVVEYDYFHSYDENGNMVESVFHALEGDHVYTYAYDEDGRLVNHQGSIPNEYSYNNDYTYDENGNLTERVLTMMGEPYYTLNYTYDSEGNCIKEERTYSDGKEVYTKEYDENGNVISEVITRADGSVESAEWQYVLTYITIDVPAASMEQIMGLFEILQF